MAGLALGRREAVPVVAATRDRALLRAFLERDRLYAAYALCDLEEREFSRTRWGIATIDGGPIALVMEYHGPSPQPVFVMGDPEAAAAILRTLIRPRIAYLAVRPENLGPVQALYRLDRGPQMARMWVDRARFRPVEEPAVERLAPSDAMELNRLYRLGIGAWLPPQAVAEGVYHGIRVRGRLVSAAGTHVISPTARLGVVGNVFTHADHRGKGYATAVTGAVTAELLRTCDHVALNVRSDNPPAINAYRRLGYAEHCRYEERLARRIGSPWGELAAALRERLGRLLGAGPGPDTEIEPQ
jgi:RimJ/RimL family protein N-acetyltransferase